MSAKHRRTLPRCTETMQGGERFGEECGRPARYALSTRYQQGFVCGNHRRGWQPTALYHLTPVEATA